MPKEFALSQESFDKLMVAAKDIDDNGPCMNKVTRACYYRRPETALAAEVPNTACIVGKLIPDKYFASEEASNRGEPGGLISRRFSGYVYDLISIHPIVKEVLGEFPTRLLSRLQSAHDQDHSVVNKLNQLTEIKG